ALDQSGDANRQAAAALHVAAAACGDAVVNRAPGRTGADTDRRLRRLSSFAALRDERLVQDDVVHRASPDQKGIRCAGCALVAVAAAVDHKAKPVLTCEVDGSSHVLARASRNGVGAWF